MTDRTERILIHVGVATLRLTLIATALAGIGGAQAVHAQEEPGSLSWGDVGISVSPLFRAHVDVESCCTPLGGWVTWGTGTFRLQMDYVYNRRRYLDYPGYYEERLGQEIAVERAYLDTHVEQAVGDDSPYRSHLIFPQVGVGADIPIGSRVFARAQFRLFIAEVRIGVGLRF